MNRLVAVIALCSSATVPVAAMPAFAQAPHALETVDQAKNVRRGLEYGAQCLLDHKSSAVKSFLAKYPGSKDAARTANYLSQGDCVDGSSGPQQLQFSAIVLRGALFKALYARDFADGAGTLTGATMNFTSDVGGQDAEGAPDYISTRRFAECVVRKAPEAARAVVIAPVETAQERQAFDAMQPSVVTCAGTVRLPEMSRTMLVGVVAEVLYRLSKPESPSHA